VTIEVVSGKEGMKKKELKKRWTFWVRGEVKVTGIFRHPVTTCGLTHLVVVTKRRV